MKSCLKFYINGEWVEPNDPKPLDVINPANEEVLGQIMLGNAHDVNNAVAAAVAVAIGVADGCDFPVVVDAAVVADVDFAGVGAHPSSYRCWCCCYC